MIQILGIKRVMILGILIVLNGVMAAAVYLVLMPQHQQKEMQLMAVRGEVSTMQSNIDRMQTEFDQLKLQQDRFDQLKARGFFFNQGRRQAELVFESIQKQAGVISAVANIQAGAVEESEPAQRAEHKVLKSPIKVHIDAVDSVDVFRYIYLLDRFFPGHLAIQNIKLERKSEITSAVLRGIASGSNPVLVQADIEMTWRTMIPQSEIIESSPPGQ